MNYDKLSFRFQCQTDGISRTASLEFGFKLFNLLSLASRVRKLAATKKIVTLLTGYIIERENGVCRRVERQK
jgi:hypothetical protein